MRLIDADALEKSLTEKGDDYKVSMFATSDDCNIARIDCNIARIVAFECAEEVKNAPTIEAEPVRHGRWEWIVNGGCMAYLEPIEPLDAGWGCSVCGIDLMRYLQSHFPDIPSYLECACEEMPTLERCPNCGAEMNAKDIDVPTTQMEEGAEDG